MPNSSTATTTMPATSWSMRGDNVVMLRTFSKIYALGGLRLGWAYCPPAIADVLNRVRGPFNVSPPAQAAASPPSRTPSADARAAPITTWRHWLSERLAELGLPLTPASAIFLLVSRRAGAMPMPPTRFLKSRGILTARWAAMACRTSAHHRSAPRRRCAPWPRHSAEYSWRSGAMSEPLFKRVALIGIGLIGSSLGPGAAPRQPRHDDRRLRPARPRPCAKALRARACRRGHP